MNRIPAWMLKDSLVIKPYEGESGMGGPVYGAEQEIKAHLEPRNRLIIDRNGREVRAEMFAITFPEEVIPAESQAVLNGRTYRVIEVFRVPSPRGGTHHLEVAMG